MSAGPLPKLRVVADATATSDVRGQRILKWLELPILRLERALDAILLPRFNPLTQAGAIANTALLVAVISGIVLLIWYSPSVHQAYDSLAAMEESPWTAGLTRSLHRYSSDICVLFVLLHALRLTLARRFTGPRWIAWITGALLVAALWFAGWLGYWLVWDERGQQVAVGSARVLDLLPVVSEPMSREFLTNESTTSLLFFLVFFVHMLIPLPMLVALWLHIVRVTRSKYLTDIPTTLWVVGGLVVVSLVYPATSADPADMAVVPDAFTMDWWYLAPLALTDRLSGGVLWTILVTAGLVLYSVPWTLRRARTRPAKVEPTRCNACRNCYTDCPYDAITMVARDREGGRGPVDVAFVDPAKCVGCGICTGSCDSAGVGIQWLKSVPQRAVQDRWLEDSKASDSPEFVAFVCAESAGAELELDPETGESPALPGYHIQPVPCAGWVHPLTVERALRHGASGVLIVACPENRCSFREGTAWTAARLGGVRAPTLREERVDPSKVKLLELDRSAPGRLRRQAEAFRRGAPGDGGRRGSALRTWVGPAVVTAIVGLITVVASDFTYVSPPSEPSLVVSFYHPGETGEDCRELSSSEQADQLKHMRRSKICERRRADVRLRVHVDGELLLERSYSPAGLSGDGRSLALERLPMPAGEHTVRVEIGDTLDEEAWNHASEQVVEFDACCRRVVLFDNSKGITWH